MHPDDWEAIVETMKRPGIGDSERVRILQAIAQRQRAAGQSGATV
jgi:hypothetical protein